MVEPFEGPREGSNLRRLDSPEVGWGHHRTDVGAGRATACCPPCCPENEKSAQLQLGSIPGAPIETRMDRRFRLFMRIRRVLDAAFDRGMHTLMHTRTTPRNNRRCSAPASSDPNERGG